MQALWLTWVLPVLLAGVWVAIAISEWRRSREPTPEIPDWQSFVPSSFQN